MRIAICDDDGAREAICAVRWTGRWQGVTSGSVPGVRPAGERLVADAANGDPFDLVFLDVYLEGVDGVSAARVARGGLRRFPSCSHRLARACGGKLRGACDRLPHEAHRPGRHRARPRSGSACERASTGVSGGRIAALFAFGDIVAWKAAIIRCCCTAEPAIAAWPSSTTCSRNDPRFLLPSQLFGEHGLHSRRLRRFHSTRRNMRAGTREERRKMREAYHRYFVDAL